MNTPETEQFLAHFDRPGNLRQRIRVLVASAALALLVTLVAAPASAACGVEQDTCPDPSTSGLEVPLTGSVFYAPTDELVNLSARLHLSSSVHCPDGHGRLNSNVARSTAVGQDTGGRYQFNGADTISLPPNPVRCGQPSTLSATVSARLFPTDRLIPNDPVRVSILLDLSYDAHGRLTTATASIGPVSEGP